jgi:hypothetical protein
VAWVDGVADALWDEMKAMMVAEMETILRARGWPSEVAPEAGMDAEWMACFEKMLDLQLPEVVQRASESAVVTMLPFDAMAAIMIAEFKYHFLSDRPTSHPDTFATHCIQWWVGAVEKWEPFFRDNVGPLLASKLRGSPAALRPAYADPACALVASMLPVMREKVATLAAAGRKNPAYLSGLISDLLGFDATLAQQFGYDVDGDGGVADAVLLSCFDQWFEAEKEFALERYRGIVEAPDARQMDYDFGAGGRTCPTHAAVRIMDLIKTVTGLYDQTRRFGHKIRFLIGIQVEILDRYHDRLRESLEAYYAMTSTVGRTLHGITRDQLAAVEGTRGLETLCKVFGSADHVVGTLKEWSNEEVCLGRVWGGGIHLFLNHTHNTDRPSSSSSRCGTTSKRGRGTAAARPAASARPSTLTLSAIRRRPASVPTATAAASLTRRLPRTLRAAAPRRTTWPAP